MSNEFIYWLADKLKRKSWSQRELANRTGFSHSLIGKVISGAMPPSAEFCIKAAQALGEPAETALRLAGFLPGEPLGKEDQEAIREGLELLRGMSADKRRLAIRLLRFLYQDEE